MRLLLAIALAAAFAAPALAQDAVLLGGRDSSEPTPRLKPAAVRAGQEVTLSSDFTAGLSGGVAVSTAAGGCDGARRARLLLVDGRARTDSAIVRHRQAVRFRRAVGRLGG